MSLPPSDSHSWAYCPQPQGDEILSAWLGRVAHTHGQTLHRFGVDRLSTQTLTKRDIDRTASIAFLERVAHGANTSLERIRAMTLQPFEERMSHGPRAAGVGSWILPTGQHRAKFRHGRQVCLACQLEGRSSRRAWRLAFVVACEDHDAWLIDGCPMCDAPLAAVDPVAGLRTCGHCHAHWTAPVTNTGPFFSQAVQLQRWLLDALYSNEDPALGQGKLALKDLLHGLRLLGRLDRRLNDVQSGAATIENLRIGDRIAHVDRLATLLSAWPEGLVGRALEFGLSRQPFHGDSIPAWIRDGLVPLREIKSRRPAPSNEDPMLRKLRRRHPANWRSRYAHRLVRLAKPS